MTATRAFLAAALLACCAGSAAAAVQGSGLRGRVLDGEGRPIAGIEVALHRVTPAGGAIVDRATTAADGSFTLAVPASAEDAIFFAATRVDGRLYLGGFFRGAAPQGVYEILAQGPGVQRLGEQAPPSGARGPASWPLALGTTLLLAAGGVLAARSATRGARHTRRRRALLLKIAALDESHAARGGEADPDDHERYLSRRARLRDGLRSVAQRAH